MMDKKFTPNYAVHPGESLVEALDTISLKQKELSLRTGLTEKHISEIVQGKSPITPETALKLEYVLSIPASFWLELQRSYDENIAREEHDKRLTEEVSLIDRFPYAEMFQKKWIDSASTGSDKVSNLLKFFGVDSLNSVELVHSVAFRRSRDRHSSPESIAAWLRKGDIEAMKVETQSFDKDKLHKAIPRMRQMTQQSPQNYYQELSSILSESGIVLVVLPHLSNTYVNGAARWVSSDKALILLTLLYKYADIFWFTLFHELGHILLSGKRQGFLDIKGDVVDDSDERQADKFAQDGLIPSKAYEAYVERLDFSPKSIKNFAKEVDIDCGIVVGRLQHEGHLKFSALNGMRTKYGWSE